MSFNTDFSLERTVTAEFHVKLL